MGKPLEVNERTAFAERFGIIQRVCWGLMAIAVAVALSGLTGAGGPWSQTVVGDVTFPAITRAGASDQIVMPASLQETKVLAEIGAWFDIQTITPAGGDSVVLTVRAREAGWASMQVPTDAGGAVTVEVLILP